MREFTIFTDSSCDLSATMAQELGLTVLPLSVNIDGTSYENDLAGKALPFDTCYALLRAGKPATTSALSQAALTCASHSSMVPVNVKGDPETFKASI